MRAIIIAILITWANPYLAFSQFNSSIDLIIGMDYSYRNLNTSSNEGIVISILEKRDSAETGKLNGRLGFNFNKRLTNKLHLKTGIRLASIGYKGEKKTGLKWGSEHDGMGGWTPDPNLPHEIQFIDDYWFIEIPIAGRYEFGERKLIPYIELGASPSFFLKTRTKTITDISTETRFHSEEPLPFNKFHLVGNVSFGANYLISENMQVFGQPIFRYHLTKLVDAPIKEYLYDYGIEIGIRRKI